MRSLKVAYVGNFTKPWCTEVHIAQALHAAGHQVLRLQENRTNWFSLAALAQHHRADMVMWTRTWDVNRDAALAQLDGLRRAGIPTVSYHLDRWWGLDREYQITSEPFFRTDLVVTADGGHDDDWKRVGVNHRWFPPGVLASACVPTRPAPRRWTAPIVFVGSHPYPHREWAPIRGAMIEKVAAEYGSAFKVLPGYRRPAIRGRLLSSLYATVKVVVGDSCLVGGAARYWSDRIPETLGRGAFLIHPNVEGLGEHFTPGEHLATFDVGDHDDLLAKIDYYLTNDSERQAIAAAGRAHVLQRHTYERRMADLVELLAVEGML